MKKKGGAAARPGRHGGNEAAGPSMSQKKFRQILLHIGLEKTGEPMGSSLITTLQ